MRAETGIGAETAGGGGAPRTGPEREDWIDGTRGAALLLVVFGHVWRGLGDEGMLPPGLFRTVDGAIYLFHMPVFFLLSGMVFRAGMGPGIGAGMGRVAGRMGQRMLWPLLIWYAVYAGLTAALAGDAARIWEYRLSQSHLWFLVTLLAIQILSLWALRARPAALVPVAVGIALGAHAALVLAGGWVASWGPWGPWGILTLVHLPAFLLGLALARAPRPAWEQRGGQGRDRRGAGALALGLLGGALALDWSRALDVPARSLAGLAAALGFLVLLRGLWVGGLWAGGPRRGAGGALGRALAALGRAAMAVYLAHILFTAATRMGLLALGVADPAAQVALGCLAGVAGPLALLAVLRRLGLARLAGL